MSVYRIILIVLCLFSSSCFKPSYEEIDRITSPNDLVDAVIIEMNSGALSAYGYLIYIVHKGEKPNFKKGFEKFRAEKVNNLKVNWKDSKMLIISYDKAKIYNFTNFSYIKDRHNKSHIIELELRLKPRLESSL